MEEALWDDDKTSAKPELKKKSRVVILSIFHSALRRDPSCINCDKNKLDSPDGARSNPVVTGASLLVLVEMPLIPDWTVRPDPGFPRLYSD